MEMVRSTWTPDAVLDHEVGEPGSVDDNHSFGGATNPELVHCIFRNVGTLPNLVSSRTTIVLGLTLVGAILKDR